jgi:hypothetical protein
MKAIKRTAKLFEPERYEYADGTVEKRDEVTVVSFAKTSDHGRERTVWIDEEGADDGCGALYTLECGKLWAFDGDYFFD